MTTKNRKNGEIILKRSSLLLKKWNLQMKTYTEQVSLLTRLCRNKENQKA